MKNLFRALLIISLTNCTAFSQKEYKIHLKTIDESPKQNVNNRSFNTVLDGYYIVQFENHLTDDTKQNLSAAGFSLLKYIPNFTWILSAKNSNSISLKEAGARYIESYSLKHKTNINSGFSGEKSIVIQSFNLDETKRDLGLLNIPFTLKGELMEVVVTEASFQKVLEIQSVYFVEVAEEAPQLEILTISRGKHADGNTQRSNYIGYNPEDGYYFDGTGVEISIKEGGSVNLDDTINYRGRSIFHDIASDVSGHKTGVVLRAASAGITSPGSIGAAPGATVHTNNGVKFGQSNIIIESRSYGWGCATAYNSGAASHDNDVIADEYGVFSYSAGNSGSKDCTNGFGAGWNNITGNNKQAKNIFTVGSVNNNDGVYGFSSRGPAYDGRIKPEIVTSGGGGTSHATPAFAGFWAQIQQAYKYYNSGTEAKSDLLKCITLNSADDAGNEGPDYIYGWGRINARKAHDIIQSASYFSGSLANGQAKSHSISVPSGIKQIKVMVYWHDPAAASNVSKALVNDIDLTVSNGGSTYNPYSLNGTSSVDVGNSATKAADHLNNMEQVVINNPAAGTYSVDLTGFSIAQGPQHYTVCYYLDNGVPEIVSPLGGNSFSNTSSIRVFVDGAEHEAVDVLYSINQVSWESIGTIAQGGRYIDWTPPTGFNENKVYLKATNSIGEDELNDAVYILNTPANLALLSRCDNELTLTWDEVEDADQYIVFKLGSKYMEPIDTVSIPQFTYSINSASGVHFAIASLTSDGAVSLKTPAYKPAGGVSNCSGVVADFIVSENIVEIGDTVFITDLSINNATSWDWSTTLGVLSNPNDQNPYIVFNSSGISNVTLTASNSGSTNTTSKTAIITVVPKTNYGLSFDGVDEYLDLVEYVGPKDYDEFTMEAWIKPGSGNNGERGIFGSNHTSEYYSGFILDIVDNTKLKFGYGPGSWSFRKTTANILTTGEWQHVALVFNKSAGKIYLYLNGVNINSINVTDNSWQKDQTYIGRSDANGGYFEGYMDDVRMWGRALNQTDLGYNNCDELPNTSAIIFASNSNLFNQGFIQDTITDKSAQAVNMEVVDWQEIDNSNCEVADYLVLNTMLNQWFSCDSVRLSWSTNLTGNGVLTLNNSGGVIDTWNINEVGDNYFAFYNDYQAYDLTDGYTLNLVSSDVNETTNSFEFIQGCNIDCNNDLDGNASTDNCGVCSGGNTGVIANSSCVIECSDPIEVFTSSFQSPNSGDLTLDGNLNTRWSAEGDGEWILYKFPCLRLITNLQVAFFSGDVRTTTFDVEVSTDSLSWESLGQFTSSGATLELEDFELSSNNISYLKIIGRGNSSNTWNSYTEVDFEFSLEDDCNNDLGGMAFIDSCETCAGGNTGEDAILDPSLCVITALNELNNEVVIYPTVLQGGGVVTIKGYQGELVLYTLLGEVAANWDISKGEDKVSINGLALGAYFLKSKGTHTFYRKIIVK